MSFLIAIQTYYYYQCPSTDYLDGICLACLYSQIDLGSAGLWWMSI
jgi:hypothetical protein